MRKGLIYIIKNKCNDKVYIGQTIQSADERFKQHLKPSILKQRGSYKIYNAIKKYGKHNFYIEIIENDVIVGDLNNLESFYIEKFNSFNDGYNSTNGGDSKLIYSIDDTNSLIDMVNCGKTNKDIAKIFNVNVITIQRTLKSLSIKRNRKVTKEYLMKNKDNRTNIDMANDLNVSEATITRAFNRFNIERGTGCSNSMNKQNKPRISKESLLKNIKLSFDEMAIKFNTSKYYIAKLFKKYDISK